ncbi:E3 ubiquitin-protein ligase meiotic P26 [Amblyomma americanum]
MTEEKAMESGNLSPLGGSEERDPVCAICNAGYKQPRILACLHIYCESCLESSLEKQAAANKAIGKSQLECPDCGYRTKMVGRGVVDSCPLEHMMVNELDRAALETLSMVCTSCKAKETAVARCTDCASFLCNNCVTAHRYMRCFESHVVVTFDELGGAPDPNQIGEVHRPLACPTHASELLKHYCLTCQVPICNECTLGEHKPPEHECERATEAGAKQREELQALLTESRNHVQSFEESVEQLQNGLTDLQQQRDTAKTSIQETFEKYKSLLEKRQEELLEELEKLHSEEELHIMDSLHIAEKTTEHIEEACRFVNRLLEHANAVELLSLKQLVTTRLRNLIAGTPKLEALSEMGFEFDLERFEKALGSVCGRLRRPRAAPSPPPPPAPLSASPTPPSSSPVNGGGGGGLVGNTSPIHSISSSLGGGNMSPLHSTSSSLGGGAGNGTSMSVACASMSPIHASAPSLAVAVAGSGSLSPPLHSAASSLEDAAVGGAGDPFAALAAPPLDVGLLTSAAAQYNLARLANMADTGPEDSEQGTDVPVTMADLLLDPTLGVSTAEQNVLNNLTALAKLGSVSLNNAGQIMLNGQVVPGLTLEPNAQTSPPPLLPSGRPSSGSSGSLGSHHQLLDTLLNGSTLSPRSSSRGSPMLDSLVNGSGILGQRVPILAAGSGLVSPSLSVQSGYVPPPRGSSNKLNTMQIRCKFGQLGPSKGQFSSPHGFCLGLEEEIIVADTNNHRIQVFDKSGEFKYTFGVAGKDEGQLWYPRKVAVIKSSGKYVICDRGNERSRMQIFTKGGHFIKKIAIRYIDIVAGLAITAENKIVAVDSVSPTVFVISEAGELLLWFDCSEYMREPSDIAISGREYYICDFKGHCVIVFSEEGQYLRKIGYDGMTNFPNGIDISDAGDVLVGDSHGNRFHVVVFSRDGGLLSEFECPYVKVSRCCGLKITSEGYVVTLAKNNHHVLVLNTLYIV